MGKMKVLRLMPDYGVEWPLWTERGPVIDPRSLGLSEPLLEDIRRWFDEYLIPNVDVEDEIVDELAFEAEGQRLAQEIQAQLGPSYQVRCEL